MKALLTLAILVSSLAAHAADCKWFEFVRQGEKVTISVLTPAKGPALAVPLDENVESKLEQLGQRGQVCIKGNHIFESYKFLIYKIEAVK